MGHSRTVVFMGSFVVSAALLILFATGFFDKTSSPQELPKPASHMMIADSDSGEDDGSGDADQGTELQDPEQQEQQAEQDQGGGR